MLTFISDFIAAILNSSKKADTYVAEIDAEIVRLERLKVNALPQDRLKIAQEVRTLKKRRSHYV